MRISVKNAHANNLKNISVDIPIGEITAFTGVSGSGKSTLLREIIGAYGARSYSCIAAKTVRDALLINNDVEVDEIENLPNTILIDVKSTVSNPLSTVSTVSGIHEILRNLFLEYGVIRCKKCGSLVSRDYSSIKRLIVDLRIDDRFDEAIDYIQTNGNIIKIEYFDKNGNVTNSDKKKALATVLFSLNRISEKVIKEFNKQFSCSVCVISEKTGIAYDFVKEIECNSCYDVIPNLIRSRMSYSTSYADGGGACRCCKGTGRVTSINPELIFQDKTKGILEGATPFVNAKGIKYSTVTEKFLSAVYKKMGLNIEIPVESISDKDMNVILYGSDSEISFMDRTGGKKNLIYEGIVSYLATAYRTHKGGELLSGLAGDLPCPECGETRFDSSISCFVFGDENVSSLMKMTLSELGHWCKSVKKKSPKKTHKYLDRIVKETANFELLSCGHLGLFRSSNTLSGGELQRIRVCALLNADINGLCYLLDEPSSGLHYSDIEKLAELMKKICDMGNTIIMVEHNKKMLSYCDNIVDLGPLGGKRGGNVLFSSSIADINNYDTATTRVMQDTSIVPLKSEDAIVKDEDYIEFKDLSYNNLKKVDVRFPRNSFTTVCGVSGSGKSTFVRKAVLALIGADPKSYGFDEVDYIGQADKVTTNISTVSSLIKIGDYIAKLYEKASGLKYKKNCFMIGAKDGKCSWCGGKGKLYSAANEVLGLCDQCGGKGFDEDILKIKVDGLDIYELYNMDLEDLGVCASDHKIKSVSEIANRLGVGYLTFARQAKTLSKGELQRVSLINVLLGKENHHLLIMDEPSKGLHISDTVSLVRVLREITKAKNTVIVVEHNPEMIKNADYIIEFGGTGVNGGYLLFQGEPSKINGTPTAKMLSRFKINKKNRNVRMKRDIVIDDNGNSLRYERHSVYVEKDHSDALVKAAKRSQDDFLSVAIPNNPMFSRLDRNIIESDTPIMMLVDFGEKIKYNISVADALSIRQMLCEAVAEENEESIVRYVFDPNSSTGKCLVCGGTGKTSVVDIDYFLQSGDLNSACKRFLKNSTDYVLLSKIMKRDGIDITKKYSVMTKEERKVLVWGTDKIYELSGKEKRWEGIMPYFMQYHKYYPDNDSDDVFKKKVETECPICGGERIKLKYMSFRCCGMSYKEWMSVPLCVLLKRLGASRENRFKKISERLKLMCDWGLDNISLSNDLATLDSLNAGKVKLASICFNKIYDIGVVINNLDALDGKDKNNINKKLNNLAKINTIWIVG